MRDKFLLLIIHLSDVSSSIPFVFFPFKHQIIPPVSSYAPCVSSTAASPSVLVSGGVRGVTTPGWSEGACLDAFVFLVVVLLIEGLVVAGLEEGEEEGDGLGLRFGAAGWGVMIVAVAAGEFCGCWFFVWLGDSERLLSC